MCVLLNEWIRILGKRQEEPSSWRQGKGRSRQSPVVCCNQCWDDSLWTRMSCWPGGEDAGCTPCKWDLAAAIKRPESIYNQGDLKPPITLHCLPRHKAPTISNMRDCSSLFTTLGKPRPPEVTRPQHTASSRTRYHWPAWLWCLRMEPYLAFGIDIWWLLNPVSGLFQIYHIVKAQGLLWPEVLTTLLP